MAGSRPNRALCVACLVCAFATPHAAAAEDLLRGRTVSSANCAGGNCFVLIGIAIDGSTVFSQSELGAAYEPYLAQAVSTSDLARIAQSITDRYRAAGYFLSRAIVPTQDAASGIARIVVVEGRISELVLEGDAAAIAPFMQGVEGGGPARLQDIDRRLALAGDTPGLTIHTRIEPDPNDLARHRLVVTAEVKQFAASAALDNRGSQEAGPLQAYGRFAVRGVLASRDELAVAALATPGQGDELLFLHGSYARLLRNGGRLEAEISAFRTHDGADMQSPNVGGEGEGAAVSYQLPLHRTRAAGLWIGAGFDAREVRYDWQGGGGYADNLRVAQLLLRGFLGENGRSTTFAATGSFGLDVLGASDASLERRSRFDADGQSSTLNLHLTHYQDIGRAFGVFASLDAQTANGPLLFSQEFTVGGLPYGRAYNYGEISGDRGIAGQVELRAGAPIGPAPITFLQGYLFYDGAQVWNFTDGPDPDLSLSSTGAGVRIWLAERIVARAELARPLSRRPSEESGKDWRSFFSLAATY